MGYEDTTALIPLNKLSLIADWYNISVDYFFINGNSVYINIQEAVGSGSNNINSNNNIITINNDGANIDVPGEAWATKPASTEQLQLVTQIANPKRNLLAKNTKIINLGE